MTIRFTQAEIKQLSRYFNYMEIEQLEKQEKFNWDELIRLSKCGFGEQDIYFLAGQDKYTLDDCIKIKKKHRLSGSAIQYLAHRNKPIETILKENRIYV